MIRTLEIRIQDGGSGWRPSSAARWALHARELSAPHLGMQFRKGNGRMHRGRRMARRCRAALNMVRAVQQQSDPGLSIGAVPTPWHDLLSWFSCHEHLAPATRRDLPQRPQALQRPSCTCGVSAIRGLVRACKALVVYLPVLQVPGAPTLARYLVAVLVAFEVVGPDILAVGVQRALSLGGPWRRPRAGLVPLTGAVPSQDEPVRQPLGGIEGSYTPVYTTWHATLRSGVGPSTFFAGVPRG